MTMYLTGLINQFTPHWTIHELGLDDGKTGFYIDTIDNGHNISPGQYQMAARVFMPSYFSSMNHTDMWKILRPMTHELVSLDDEIIHMTGRTQHTNSGCWSPSTTTPIPAYYNNQ